MGSVINEKADQNFPIKSIVSSLGIPYILRLKSLGNGSRVVIVVNSWLVLVKIILGPLKIHQVDGLMHIKYIKAQSLHVDVGRGVKNIVDLVT
ncbi:hypothetical protein TNCV_3499441 [Trichonephila clavipes]|nr:hypothetical protein TNCV_3499441 [Trichonephila clavipes]